MKKISYLEIAAIFLIILISFNCGINLYVLKLSSGINSWLSLIISQIFGIIPILLIIYIANYKPELNLFEKNKNLFGNVTGTIINIFISTILFIIALTLLYNIVSFITTQFLYHTPIIISSILLISLSIYCAIKEINVIAHISLILITINGFLFLTSNISLINNIKLDNLLPILKTNTNYIIPSAIKMTIINILPAIIILIIPKNKITDPHKLNKTLILTYIISSIITIITSTFTICTLGIHLTKAFEYSEYMVLKKIKLFGFLERGENIISLKWISETYIYITLIIYSITKNFTFKKTSYLTIAIGILLIIGISTFFPNITVFNNYTEKEFINIVSLLIIPYILITIKIYINKTRKM